MKARSIKAICAADCVALALWCSIGTLGLAGSASMNSRLGLLPSGWLLAVFIIAALAAVRLLPLSTSHLSPLFGAALVILPWLPVPLPASVLLWTGPFMLAIWLAVIAGVIVSIGRPIRSRWLMDPRRAPLVAAIVALALYGGSAWWLSSILPEGDAPHYLIISQSLIEDGDLKIENNHQRGDYLAYSRDAAKPDYLRRGTDGAIYSIHAPGLPALIALAFLLFGFPGVVAFLALVGALGTALVWHLGHRVTGSASAAWFGWGCCALTAPFFFQATRIFPDGLAATCVLVGMFPLMDTAVRRDSTRMWLLSGLSLAVLPWLQTRLVVIAVAAALALMFRIRSVRQLAIFAAAPLVSAASWFGYFYTIYGTANPSAPYGNYTQMAVAHLVQSVPGVLFDQQFGLISNAPVYGVVLVGVIAAAACLRRWAWELLIVLVPYVIVVGMFRIWWGGSSAPARLMTPLTMLLGVAAARIWHNARTPATKAVGLAALGASLLVSAALLIPEHGRLLFNFRDGFALWLEWANQLIDLPRAVPSLFRDTPQQAWVKAAVWGACFAAAWVALRTIGGGAESKAGAAQRLAWATPWCLAGAAMIALSLIWRLDRAQPLTPETGEIALVRHASALRPVAYDYRARRFESPRLALSQLRLKTSARRPVPRPAPLLTLSDVPPGRYRLHVSGSALPSGKLLLRIGKTPLTTQTWQVFSPLSRSLGAAIRLPVDVRSLIIEGDEPARASITSVQLEPITTDEVGHAEAAKRGTKGLDLKNIAFKDDAPRLVATSGAAERAARYGSAEVYFMDENAYPELQGFWITGGRDTRIVIANYGVPLRLFLRNAPVDNTVTMTIDGTRHEVGLRPGEEMTIVLPRRSATSEAVVRIQARDGFRPSQVEPGNLDLRYLGCWVEIK